MDDKIEKISHHDLLLYFIVVIVICGLATYFSYDGGMLSSRAWSEWQAQKVAWQKDLLRVMVASIFGFFVLWHMRVLTNQRAISKGPRLFIPKNKTEWFFFVFLVCLLLYNLHAQGVDFKGQDVNQKYISSGQEFTEVWKPYLLYVFYAFGYWFGLVWPVFVTLLRWLIIDWHWKREIIKKLNNTINSSYCSQPESLENIFREITIQFHTYMIGLKELAERYVTLIIAITLMLLIEDKMLSTSVTDKASELSKYVMWLLLGPALLCFLRWLRLGIKIAYPRLMMLLVT